MCFYCARATLLCRRPGYCCPTSLITSVNDRKLKNEILNLWTCLVKREASKVYTMTVPSFGKMAKLLLLIFLAGPLIWSCDALEGCEDSDNAQCMQQQVPADCRQLMGLPGNVRREGQVEETSRKVEMRNDYLRECQ